MTEHARLEDALGRLTSVGAIAPANKKRHVARATDAEAKRLRRSGRFPRRPGTMSRQSYKSILARTKKRSQASHT
jgi:hypothetical protein